MAPSDAVGEGQSAAESYGTFCDAVPVDLNPGASACRADIMGFDPYSDFLALTEEEASSWLTVEETDVG